MKEHGLDTHFMTVEGGAGRPGTVVIDGRCRGIWTLGKYLADGAVGSLINSNQGVRGRKANVVHVKTIVPAGLDYRFAYTDSPKMRYVILTHAARDIENGEQLLVNYGTTYGWRHSMDDWR